jgi:hypothetical protein
VLSALATGKSTARSSQIFRRPFRALSRLAHRRFFRWRIATIGFAPRRLLPWGLFSWRLPPGRLAGRFLDFSFVVTGKSELRMSHRKMPSLVVFPHPR